MTEEQATQPETVTEPTETVESETTTETPAPEKTAETTEPAKDKKAEAEDWEAKAKKAKEQADYWASERKRNRDDYFREKGKPPEKPTEAPPDGFKFSDPEPKEEGFDNYSDWVRKHQEWTWKKNNAEMQYHQSRQSQVQQQQEFGRKWAEKVDDLHAKDPDIAKKGLIPPELVPLLMDSEYLPQFAYHFGENIQDAGKIVGILRQGGFSPHSIAVAAREIGRMEAKFASMPPQKSKTNAPAPTRSVGSGEGPPKKLEDMSTAEFIAMRNKQEFGATK